MRCLILFLTVSFKHEYKFILFVALALHIVCGFTFAAGIPSFAAALFDFPAFAIKRDTSYDDLTTYLVTPAVTSCA